MIWEFESLEFKRRGCYQRNRDLFRSIIMFAALVIISTLLLFYWGKSQLATQCLIEVIGENATITIYSGTSLIQYRLEPNMFYGSPGPVLSRLFPDGRATLRAIVDVGGSYRATSPSLILNPSPLKGGGFHDTVHPPGCMERILTGKTQAPIH